MAARCEVQMTTIIRRLLWKKKLPECRYIHYIFILHRVREKKRPQYSKYNFDKFSQSFVIFGMNHPDTSTY